MVSTTSLSKKTKDQLIGEYMALLSRLDGADANAKETHGQQSIDVIAGAKQFTTEAVERSVAELKSMTQDHVNALTRTVQDELGQLLAKMTDQVRQFSELQVAIDLSRKTLETQYDVQLAAETLRMLVEEQEAGRRQFEEESLQKNHEAEERVAARKRGWEREQEEYDYRTKTDRERSDQAFDEARQGRERELSSRESQLKAQEAELARWRKDAEEMPGRVEGLVAAREHEVIARVTLESQRKLDVARREWESEKGLMQLQQETLDAQVKKLEAEIFLLKKESEAANKKAQELAVKVIESGTRRAEGQAVAA